MGYLTMLGNYGRFVQVGAPEDAIPGFNCFALIAKVSGDHTVRALAEKTTC